MNVQFVFSKGQEALLMMLMVSMPVLITVLVIGLAVSIFQAMTQIHEASLSFVPKLLGAVAVISIAGPWMLTMMVDYIRRTLVNFSSMIT